MAAINTMTRKSACIGIMGGTFDPIHFGHLVAAEAARCEYNLEKVIFVPSAKPPHKQGLAITADTDRLSLTNLAIDGNPFFEISNIEFERQGLSYSVDTIRFFKNCFPGKSFYFITGADAILEILSWKNVHELMNMCQFIAVTRPGFSLANLHDLMPDEYLDKINFLEVPGLAISSTEIRERVKNGKSIKYLVPKAVEEYIIRQKLYR